MEGGGSLHTEPRLLALAFHRVCERGCGRHGCLHHLAVLRARPHSWRAAASCAARAARTKRASLLFLGRSVATAAAGPPFFFLPNLRGGEVCVCSRRQMVIIEASLEALKRNAPEGS